MTTFPALIPSTRTFSPGVFPLSVFASSTGAEIRVRHGDQRATATLALSFLAASEADLILIRDHYLASNGNFDSFSLPLETLSAFDPDDLQVTGFSWRYVETPAVEEVGCSKFNITVKLETVTTAGG
jgi:hypothetical protein